MPSDELLMIATLIGMSLIVQVASSWLVIWKQPSPSIAQTTRSGSRDLRAHRRGHGVAHRAGAAGVEPGVRALVLDELRRPHLVLADAGGVDRLRAGQLADALDHVLRREQAVVRARCSRAGSSSCSSFEARPPLVDVGLSCFFAASRNAAIEVDDAPPSASPTIGTSACRILPISAGSMSTCTTLAFGAKSASLAGHAVVEPGAERDDAGRPPAARAPRAPCRACPACRGAAGASRGTRRAPSAS